MREVRRVSPEEAARLVREEGYTYVDVRSEPEYAAGHPAAAVNVPFLHAGPAGMTPNPDFQSVMEGLYPRDAKLLLGCKSGGRSLKAAQALLTAGYSDVVDQRAGFEGARNAFGKVVESGWATAGLPVERETPGGTYAELKAKSGA